MKFLTVLSLSLILFRSSYAQKKDSLLTINDLSNLTVMLYQPVSNVNGTATIISHNGKFYLLTANHVAIDMKESCKIVFRVGNDQASILNLVQFTKNHNLKWIDHPIADLSLVELIPFNEDSKTRLTNSSFPSYLIYSGQQVVPSDFEFVYLGFPILDLELQHFSPLYFSTHISSGLITQKRLDNNNKCTFFYLDKPGMQGCSGSGVYISVKTNGIFQNANKTVLVGVVHGTQGDNTGGKLAMITPSYYIYDMFKDL